jgi:hypothetical protein
MADGLSATAVWLKPIGAVDEVPVTIVLDDKGKSASVGRIADHLNRGEQVLAVDLAFMGEAWNSEDIPALQQMVYGTGDRPIGLETAELIEIARWMKDRAHTGKIRLETSGIRNQLVSLMAAALEPDMFSEVMNSNGMRSLTYVLAKPVEYGVAPDLFCLDLFRETDVERLRALSAPVRVLNEGPAE